MNDKEPLQNDVDVSDAKIRFFSEIVKGKNVLDIGVVQHDLEKVNMMTWLHRAIFLSADNVLGMDIDQQGVIFLNDKGYDVIYADAQAFDLDRTFDVITAGDLIEHLDNPGGFLESVKKHLGKEGVLVISTPNPFWWKTWIHVLVKGNASPHPEHTCWYCEKTIQQLLMRHGYRIDRLEYGTVFILATFFQRLTKLINTIVPLPARFRHNTMMLVAKVND